VTNAARAHFAYFDFVFGTLGTLQVSFAMYKLLSLFTSHTLSFKFFFKINMKISMNLEACCGNSVILVLEDFQKKNKYNVKY
jgi:hypothetical protein